MKSTARLAAAGLTAALALAIHACSDPAAPGNGVASVTITSGPASPRQGDVVTYAAEARGSDGEPDSAALQWSVIPASAGLVTAGGRFVGYQPGAARIAARSGSAADTFDITVVVRGLSGSFSSVGQGIESQRFTSDLWIHGSYAYTGTWGGRTVASVTRFGNALFVWDVSGPGNPVRTDSVLVDARVVNDVKIRADGALAVITHEGSADGLNGVTLLDLADPAHPTVITRFTTSLETGVHNTWVEGDYVYIAVDGVGPTSGLRVLDISNPASPTVVASYYAGSSFLHDVYVRDGLAFLAHWDAGLVILDVGSGVAAGSPTSPVEVSRLRTAGGQTHNAWYWPSAGYVFVGEEDFGTPGIMHVVDVRDLSSPKEVATFRVAGDPPHNFWLDETAGVLYLAWYGSGVQALDVTGELLGELDKQGRKIAGSPISGVDACPSSTGTATCTWAPQLHNGVLYLSDMNTGIRALQPAF